MSAGRLVDCRRRAYAREVARSITAPTATVVECALLEGFARELELGLEALHPPPPDARHTVSTTLGPIELGRLTAYARARGTTPAVILRGLALGVLRGP